MVLILFVIINFYLIQVYFPIFFLIILSMVVDTSSFKFQKEELSNIFP